MTYIVPHYLNGRSDVEETHVPYPIYNPASGQAVGQVYFADQIICDTAVRYAKEAGISWGETSPTKRARILFQFRNLLEKYQLDLAHHVTREHGKTLEDAKGSIGRAIELVEFYCGLVAQMQANFTSNASHHVDCYSLRQPLGVCAGVSPFNFPVMVPIWMVIPAIACGNTFILKPSEQDPSATLRLFELLSEAGLPPGVANCIQGDKQVVEHLLHHRDISAFTAVASTPVAESIYKTATANGKRSHTFGGAKNHAVVMPDASFEEAAKAIVGAAFGSAGERCMAISAVVAVGEKTANQLIEHLTPLIHAIRIGPGDEEESDMGPLISRVHKERVISAIDHGVEEGANLLIDGRAFKHPTHPQGYFVGPSLFDRVDESMSIYQNEIFGPVLVILRLESLEQAIALVNRHMYGNGTAIFTKDGYSAHEYSRKVQVGMVGINIPIPVPIVSHPFGGWKRSSFGDLNMHGLESMDFYTRRKTVTCKWPTTALSDNPFNMPLNQ